MADAHLAGGAHVKVLADSAAEALAGLDLVAAVVAGLNPEPFMRRVACTLTRWWAFLGPRITNLPTLAVVLLDVYATTTPEMRDLLASDHRLAAALLVLNLVARLSPRNAPLKIPGPSGMPGGGLTNPAATA